MVPLALFARLQPVTEEALKASYRTLLTSFGHAAGVVDADNPEDRADKIAQHMFRRAKRSDFGKSWIRRSGVYGARTDSPLLDALAGLTSLLLADVTPSAQAQEAVIKIFGVPEEPFLQMLGSMTLESLLAVLDRTTLHGLQMARTALHRSTATVMRMRPLWAAAGVDFPAPGISELIGANELRVAVAALAMAAALDNEPEYESRLKAKQHALELADVCDIDLLSAAARKIEINETRYPVHLARGRASKYGELRSREP